MSPSRTTRSIGERSTASVESVGMGNQSMAIRRQPDPESTRPMAEGDNFGNPVSDIITYIFLCKKHNKLAVWKEIWFPFVAINENQTWEEQANSNIAMLLFGRTDEGVEGTRNSSTGESNQSYTTLPRYKMNMVHFLRIELPSGKFQVRISYLIRLDPYVNCCKATPTLKWMLANEIYKISLKFWGPEVRNLIDLIRGEPSDDKSKYIREFTKQELLKYNSNKYENDAYYNLLRSCDINEEKLNAIFEDFIEHSFPSFWISHKSFKLYLITYGFPRNEPFKKIFQGACMNHLPFIDFFEFLFALLCLEPSTKADCTARAVMLWNYYHTHNNEEIQRMRIEELSLMLVDLRQNDIDTFRRDFPDGLTIEQFRQAIRNSKIRNTDRLCRAPKPMIPQILEAVAKHRMRMAHTREHSRAQRKRAQEGSCPLHHSQAYDYALHALELGMDDRSGYPARTINKKDIDVDVIEGMSPERYSAEVVFGLRSMVKLYLGAFREYRQNTLVKIYKDEPDFIFKLMRHMCDKVSNFFGVEAKTMKINAPACIIGDMLGCIHSVLSIDKHLCDKTPILDTNVVFLGNYIGDGSYSLEILCYVFSIKMLNPNEVILLRGRNENKDKREQYLLPECKSKFGNKNGIQVYKVICSTLDLMPMMTAIDESILCVHSGIPKSSNVKWMDLSVNWPSPLPDTSQFLLAQECILGKPAVEVSRNGKRVVPISRDELTEWHFSRLESDAFLKHNELDFLIRSSHSNTKATNTPGNWICFGKRCWTVCSHTNPPTVVFVDPGKKLNSDKVPDVEPSITFVELPKCNLD